MDHSEGKLRETVDAWDRRGWPRPRVAVVSGSGLAVDLAGEVVGQTALADLLGHPLEGIVGHPLQVRLLAVAADRHVLYYRGRLHAYQGHTPAEVVFQVRLAALLGVEAIFLSNAAGGLLAEQRPGQLWLVSDHLNLSALNPLEGHPPDPWGPRFPDMSAAYDPRLRALLRREAGALGVELPEGVYACMRGPSYETPAEVRMLRTLGADLVGMSTVLEVIAARHMGVRCACLSLVTNPAAGIASAPLHHDEVIEASALAADTLRAILDRTLAADDLLG